MFSTVPSGWGSNWTTRILSTIRNVFCCPASALVRLSEKVTTLADLIEILTLRTLASPSTEDQVKVETAFPPSACENLCSSLEGTFFHELLLEDN